MTAWFILFALGVTVGYAVDLRRRWKSPLPETFHCYPMTGLSGLITAFMILLLTTLTVVFAALPIAPTFAVMFGVPVLLGGLGETLTERRLQRMARS